jgi:hypothetical protein
MICDVGKRKSDEEEGKDSTTSAGRIAADIQYRARLSVYTWFITRTKRRGARGPAVAGAASIVTVADACFTFRIAAFSSADGALTTRGTCCVVMAHSSPWTAESSTAGREGPASAGGQMSKGALSKGTLSKGALSKGALSKGALSKGALSKGALSKGGQAKRVCISWRGQ